MIKKFVSLLLIIFLAHCSVDNKTGFWEDINQPIDSKKLTNLSFDYDKSYKQYKENIIQYGKLEDYPKLDK